LGISKGKIRLHKINGVIIDVLPGKMSPDDVRYIERMTNKKVGASSASSHAPRSRGPDDDDLPLALSQRPSQPDPSPTKPTPPSKKGPTIDWFEFFLEAGCEIDDCTRYTSSFERDKIDENILPDIKESTLRSLGLREGDIIRVSKAIEKRKPKSDVLKAQLARDEEIAKALQAEEDSGASSSRTNTTSPPNLFTGPSGALKTQQRRGRPQPRGSAPPVNVDVNSIASASDQISRTGSPLVVSPSVARATSPANVNPPKRGASAQPSGFDDDAWTIRPSSTKPTPTPPVTTSAQAPVPAPPAAPPTPAPLAPPAPPPAPPLAPEPPRPVSTNQTQQTQSTQASSQFELLAKIGQMRPPSAPTPQPSMLAGSPAIVTSPPQSFHSGLGMGSSPVPLGQHLQNQQTGLYQLPQSGLRGPLAPVPSNQGLLNPLIPTNTGFNQFVPTRPTSNPPFSSTTQSSFQPSFQSPAPASFLSTPQTGFGGTGPLMPQQTGFPSVVPQSGMYSSIPPQPTGIGGGFSGSGLPNFMPPSSFGGIQPSTLLIIPEFLRTIIDVCIDPTGFQPSFSQNGGLAPPLAAPLQKDHSPANVFAQMKSGNFGDESVPQSAGEPLCQQTTAQHSLFSEYYR
jgi:actin cytoskeleton-regulatory complex protein SLA1